MNLPALELSRKRERGSGDPVVIRGILAEGMIAHIGFIRDGWPVVLPFHYGLCDFGDGLGEQLVIHGSSGGRAFLDAAGEGVAVSVCVSLNDALVVGRSVYHLGAHYRSVVAFGYARTVPVEYRTLALDALVNQILPGRTEEVRPITRAELAATALVAIPLDHASAKVANTNNGENPDDGEDRTVWAGVIPLSVQARTPVPSPETVHPTNLPPSVQAFLTKWS